MRSACRLARQPGTSPSRIEVTMESTSAKVITKKFTRIFSARGICPCPSATIASTPHAANTAPSTAPPMASTKLSVTHCCTSRQRLAPSAARTANSFSCAVARASIMFTTLAQAISSSMPTAPRSKSNAGRIRSVTAACSGTSVASFAVMSCDSPCTRRVTWLISAMACCNGTSSFNRAIILQLFALRLGFGWL